jgi:hypothetical protein
LSINPSGKVGIRRDGNSLEIVQDGVYRLLRTGKGGTGPKQGVTGWKMAVLQIICQWKNAALRVGREKAGFHSAILNY